MENKNGVSYAFRFSAWLLFSLFVLIGFVFLGYLGFKTSSEPSLTYCKSWMLSQSDYESCERLYKVEFCSYLATFTSEYNYPLACKNI